MSLAEGRDVEICPYHWDDRQKLADDAVRLGSLYEVLLPKVGGWLDEVHGESHEVRYWRILVGPWLNRMVHVLFDRWETLRTAVETGGITGTTVLVDEADHWVPTDMTDFWRLANTADGNQHLYGLLLRSHLEVPGTEFVARGRPVEGGVSVASPKAPVRERILDLASRLTGALTRPDDPFLISTFMRWRDELSLSRRLCGVPHLWRHVPGVERHTPDPEIRARRIPLDTEDPFESALCELLPALMPTSYLEGYRSLCAKVEETPWPRRPKVIWTTRVGRDDVLKAYIASRVEAGSALVTGQHGGYYGTKRWMADEDHETVIADRFMSWGWKGPDGGNVAPVGQFRHLRATGVDHSEAANLCLVQTADHQQAFLADPMLLSRQWLDYFDEQCRFVEGLPTEVHDATTVRLYPLDYQWGQADRWRERLPDVRLEAQGPPLIEQFPDCRILVASYMGTAYLQSLAAGVPTVVFWNPDHWMVREEAAPFFDLLRNVGVFHDTPESAAAHVAAVWSDVGSWWESSEVVDAVEAFVQRYCRVPSDLLGRIESVLREATESVGR